MCALASETIENFLGEDFVSPVDESIEFSLHEFLELLLHKVTVGLIVRLLAGYGNGDLGWVVDGQRINLVDVGILAPLYLLLSSPSTLVLLLMPKGLYM